MICLMMSFVLGCANQSNLIDTRFISCDAISIVYIEDSSSLTRHELITIMSNNDMLGKYCQ